MKLQEKARCLDWFIEKKSVTQVQRRFRTTYHNTIDTNSLRRPEVFCTRKVHRVQRTWMELEYRLDIVTQNNTKNSVTLPVSVLLVLHGGEEERCNRVSNGNEVLGCTQMDRSKMMKSAGRMRYLTPAPPLQSLACCLSAQLSVVSERLQRTDGEHTPCLGASGLSCCQHCFLF
ncbi:hypothetical protein L798_10485 [Zootermopsis nevadensis]|uniref:DUF4817 domain-containing protein n=1 Tax=Zootermopsis nevadensis TaxID=136037 RepID=A0A067R0B2_ZOONE|nr:hypothetical protein L798_10485 [Zootermopsis nevadensis]